MTELEALRRVAEAAQAFFDAWDHGQATLWAIAEVGRALAALRALPAPAAGAEGEVVEVRAHVRLNTIDPTIYVVEGGGNVDGTEHWARKAGVFATIRARVPLPRVPEVVGEVG